MNLSVQYAERVYSALLSLYPVRFRVRFAPEMIQLFRDCCHDAVEKGEVAILVTVWVCAVRDLIFSLMRESGRELMRPLDLEHPLVGIVDVTLIPAIVAINLVALGPILALLVLGADKIATDQFVVTSGFFSIAFGSLAVVASIVITRLRPTVRLW